MIAGLALIGYVALMAVWRKDLRSLA
jgi:hypothetical protein